MQNNNNYASQEDANEQNEFNNQNEEHNDIDNQDEGGDNNG
jgi:hypothetical protein